MQMPRYQVRRPLPLGFIISGMLKVGVGKYAKERGEATNYLDVGQPQPTPLVAL